LGPLRFIAERIPLIEQLKLEHPEENENDFEWSPWTIAEAFAFQKGFLNAKSGRPDVHRGANLILRMNFDGRILISFKPPGFFIKASTIDLFSPTPVSSHSSEEQIVIKNKNEKKRRKQKAKQAQLHQLIGNVSD
jgi:hypothetical protein